MKVLYCCITGFMASLELIYVTVFTFVLCQFLLDVLVTSGNLAAICITYVYCCSISIVIQVKYYGTWENLEHRDRKNFNSCLNN